MRHPLRRVATQGAWYVLGNAMLKASGLFLLPVFTNTRFLQVADYGLWGVMEVTAQITVALLGLSLPIGLIRFYNQKEGSEGVAGACWWTTAALAACLSVLAGTGILALAPAGLRATCGLLLAFAVFELLGAIPMALLRAREQAGRHTFCLGLKLALLVGLGLLFMVRMKLGLQGLVGASAVSSGATLLAALAAAQSREFWIPKVRPGRVRALLRFSAPLVIGGLGSMVLNAGDRYMLDLFRGREELAVYTLAGRFGGVVNMFVIQPLNLAWLPLLFRMEEEQRPEALRLMVPYLCFGLCLAVMGLSAFCRPVLVLIGSDAAYFDGIRLVPWIALGFAAYGISTVFSGVLTLHYRTSVVSRWILIAAAANLAVNAALVPLLGAFGAALTTLLSYCALCLWLYRPSQALIPNRYPWGRLCGLFALTLAGGTAAAALPGLGGLADLGARAGMVAGWVGVVLLTRLFTVREIREALRVLLRPRTTP